MIRIELDTITKRNGNSEFRPINRARCGNHSVSGDGDVIRQLCQAMMADGLAGDVEIYRNGTLCFHPAPIETWASGKAGRGEQPEHLRRAAT